jgi:hypothetical protein
MCSWNPLKADAMRVFWELWNMSLGCTIMTITPL